MFGFRRGRKGLDISKRHEYLSEYKDEELYSVLEEIEKTDIQYLTCICAEILRRNFFPYKDSKLR